MPTGRLTLLPALLALCGPALAQQAPEPAPALPFLPPHYSQRFRSGPVDGYLGGGRFGVRRLPLPLPLDLRLTLGRVPGGLEAGLETRAQDTSFALGVFEPSPGADEWLPRVPRFQLLHSPAGGVQAGVNMQGAGFLSEAHLGVAGGFDPLGVRLLAEVGYGFQGQARAPFAHLEAGLKRSGDAAALSWNAAATARAYLFPGQAQQSLDLAGSLSWRPLPGLTLGLSHFERLIRGSVALPDLNLGPDRVTSFSAAYSLPPQDGLWHVQGFSYSYTRHWLSAQDNAAALSASLSLDFGGSVLKLAPRYDFISGEVGLNAVYLYRFPAFAVGPRLDVKRLSGLTTWTVGLALGE